MSSAPDAPAATAHAHDDHDAFDGEPAKELSPGEPETPGWLPLVGLVLFMALAVALLASGGGDQASVAIAAKPAEAPAAAPQPQAQAQPAPAAPDPTGAGALRKMTPDQIDALKKKIEEARAKGLLPNNPGQAPAR
jgi:hypothetical protein